MSISQLQRRSISCWGSLPVWTRSHCCSMSASNDSWRLGLSWRGCIVKYNTYHLHPMTIQQYLWLSMIVLRASFCRTHNITLVPIPRPITWDNLWMCFKRVMPDGTLRTIEGQEYYLQFREYIKNKNSSMPQYVKDKILGYYGDSQFPIFFIKEMEFTGQKTNLYVTGQKSYLDDFMVEPKRFKFKDGGLGPDMQFIILAKNNFPYDLEERIAHWVIWSNRGLTTEIIEEILQETILPTIEWKIFENAPNLKSVPEIAHKQIFLRRRPEKREQL